MKIDFEKLTDSQKLALFIHLQQYEEARTNANNNLLHVLTEKLQNPRTSRDDAISVLTEWSEALNHVTTSSFVERERIISTIN